ncbi:class I SAM-dependent methyltransferase [Aeoliella mucimassa]|uniref:Methyltransferase domain-containing protein n=1 Tax=Aeoliella mucimassa TaxID=2527972 RepID=A0A518AJX5_9BACT|nr:class I SAM-dependent methyltransferase [Aeoliella mucimassa]QDU54984.1 hypothetical protein Pan181_11690 [Aeoliella mucimassa]
MPKTESELWNWVVEYNRNATHDRGLISNYGYNAILDVNLVSVCKELAANTDGPVRILDVGCGSGKALAQLSQSLDQAGADIDDFEFWGMGLNRYEQMYIPEERMLYGGLNSYDFGDTKFHLILSVYAFHYFWHKLEAVERIHNELLAVGGRAYLHFPGYLLRFEESPEDIKQTESAGNAKFAKFLEESQRAGDICPMDFHVVPYYSDDDDRALLGEFGHLRFTKSNNDLIRFGVGLEAFAMFSKGFTIKSMDNSDRIYIASHYGKNPHYDMQGNKLDFQFGSPYGSCHLVKEESNGALVHRPAEGSDFAPYRITSVDIEVGGHGYEIDMAVHAIAADNVIVICPGACDSLAGELFPYRALASRIADERLGAVVRYNDPYDNKCKYADFLIEKLRAAILLIRREATHICGIENPKIRLLAYSSSAGAAAAVTSEFPEIDSLLLAAPSRDVPLDRFAEHYRKFTGNVHVLIGDSDETVLPQQAFWYYQEALSAGMREYVEFPGCGHRFCGTANQDMLLEAPNWAFGFRSRPEGFPPAVTEPSEAWLWM